MKPITAEWVEKAEEDWVSLLRGTPGEDHPDFIAWAICYQSYFRMLKSGLAGENLAMNLL